MRTGHDERKLRALHKYRMNNPDKVPYTKTPKHAYSQHRSNAKARGIEWEFTFEEWWAMWEPHFWNRGNKKWMFHMCRYRDRGPYSPGNCRIDTIEENRKEYFEHRRTK